MIRIGERCRGRFRPRSRIEPETKPNQNGNVHPRSVRPHGRLQEANAHFLFPAPPHFAATANPSVPGKRQQKLSRQVLWQRMRKTRPAGGNVFDFALPQRPSLGRIKKSNRADFLARKSSLVGGHRWQRPPFAPRGLARQNRRSPLSKIIPHTRCLAIARRSYLPLVKPAAREDLRSPQSEIWRPPQSDPAISVISFLRMASANAW